MKFDNFTLSDLAEIKQRTVQRLRAQETLRKSPDAEPCRSAPVLPSIDSICTYFSGDRSAADVRQTISRAFAENPRVLALTRSDMRETLRSASKKLSRE